MVDKKAFEKLNQYSNRSSNWITFKIFVSFSPKIECFLKITDNLLQFFHISLFNLKFDFQSHVFIRLSIILLLSDNYLLRDIHANGIEVIIEMNYQFCLKFRTNCVTEVQVLSSTLRSLLKENLIQLFGFFLEKYCTNRNQWIAIAMKDRSL